MRAVGFIDNVLEPEALCEEVVDNCFAIIHPHQYSGTPSFCTKAIDFSLKLLLPPNAAHGIQAAARPRLTEAPALGQIDPLPEVLPGIPADDLIHLWRKRRAFDGSRKFPVWATPSLPASSVIFIAY